MNGMPSALPSARPIANTEWGVYNPQTVRAGIHAVSTQGLILSIVLAALAGYGVGHYMQTSRRKVY